MKFYKMRGPSRGWALECKAEDGTEEDWLPSDDLCELIGDYYTNKKPDANIVIILKDNGTNSNDSDASA